MYHWNEWIVKLFRTISAYGNKLNNWSKQRAPKSKRTQLDEQVLYEMINITPPATVVQKTLNLSQYKRKKPASSVRTEPKKKSSRGIRAYHLSYSIFIYSSSSGFIYSSCLDFVSFIIKNELSEAECEHDIGPGPLFQSLYNFMLNYVTMGIFDFFFFFERKPSFLRPLNPVC